MGSFVWRKKGRELRPYIDYRGLNQIMVIYHYPLPLVPVALEQLCSAQIFTKLDLRRAYNLIHIQEDDEWKSAFSTTCVHYEYCVIPYGLSFSPSVLSLINDILRVMLGKYIITYIDDIIIYSPSRETHIHHVRQDVQHLSQNQLFIKGEKCAFCQHTISFQGYIISPDGISMDPAKTITEWPTPRTIKDLQ